MYIFIFLGNDSYINKKRRLIKVAVEKHLILTGTSTVSWKDAIVQTVAEASKTIDYLTSVKVIEQRAKINGKKLTEYFVDLDLTFVIDHDRD